LKLFHYYPTALQGEFGTAISIQGWTSSLARRGQHVKLVVDQARANLPCPPGVELIRLQHKYRPERPAISLAPYMRDADVVVLHGGWLIGNLLVAAEARRLGLPYVVTPHGAYYPQVFTRRSSLRKAFWWRTVERPYLERAAAIHLFFASEKQHLLLRGVARPFLIAPNGFDAPEGRSWVPAGDPYFTWLGRYDLHHKGLDLLVRGIASMEPGDRPDVRLVGVDWRGGRAKLEELVDELAISNRVSVEGPIYGEEKWTMLSGSRGFLYPSRWDASPVAVVEAIAIGVPTLVGPFPVGEHIAEQGGAFLVDADPLAIADGLKRMASADADAIGRRGAQIVSEQLSWDAVSATWLAQALPMFETGAKPKK
jgi:glycosyltransferase involved in cell wall biosynthesis